MDRRERAANMIKKISALFLEKERVSNVLLTITRVDLSPDFRNATVLLTVLPESAEAEVLAFAKQKRSDLRDLLKTQMDTKVIPYIEVEIDKGEKNRQKIDELLREK